MANRNSQLFSTILPPFETIGGDRNSLSTDGLFTRGSYHITLRTAFNLANKYKNSDVAKIYNNFSESNKGKSGKQRMKAWGNYMFENEQDEQTVANLLIEDNNNSLTRFGVDTDALTDGEYNGLHLFMWNAGAGKTKEAIGETFKRLSKFRRILREDPNHRHKDEIEQHIQTLKNSACFSIFRKGGSLERGHHMRDYASRSLCFYGTFPSNEERARLLEKKTFIDADGNKTSSAPIDDLQLKAEQGNLKAKSIADDYKDFESVYNHFNQTKRILTPPPRPLEPVETTRPGPPQPNPLELQTESAPASLEEVSPGFIEQPKEVVDFDMFPAPEVIRGDMR